jgi:endonuclease/exonuclease/phosphatase family metal-dependent hydrolase
MVGYEHRWHRTHTLLAEGIGALSRWPISFDANTMLPGSEFGGALRRAVMVIRVAHPDGDLQLFATHLTTDSDASNKADQAVAVLDFIDANPPVRAAFLGGDLNATPTDLAMQVLRGDAMHGGRTGDLVDSWATINPGDPGLTQPADAPRQRIDYLYVVPGTAGTATVLSCELALDEPMGDIYASDHLGVLCRYDLDP